MLFQEGTDSANVDAVRQDVIAFATVAQSYLLKHEMYGGGNGNFEGITFQKIDFPVDVFGVSDESALNSNGVFYLNSPAATDTSVIITAHPVSRIEGAITVTSTATVGEGFLMAEIGPSSITWIYNQ